MLARPTPDDRLSDVVQAVRLAAGVAPRRPDPGPVGTGSAQQPDHLSIEGAAFHIEVVTGPDMHVLAELLRQRRLALRRQSDPRHDEKLGLGLLTCQVMQ